jgi:hypothetical protein
MLYADHAELDELQLHFFILLKGLIENIQSSLALLTQPTDAVSEEGARGQSAKYLHHRSLIPSSLHFFTLPISIYDFQYSNEGSLSNRS